MLNHFKDIPGKGSSSERRGSSSESTIILLEKIVRARGRKKTPLSKRQ